MVDLTAIYDPAINVCVLRRSVNPEVHRFVLEALAENTGHLVRVPAISPDLDGLFQIRSDTAGARAFLDEIRVFAAVYADLVDADHLGVRLAVTRAAMCPRFHVDRVGVRLVCTYQGAGTEWLDHADVDRARMGHAAGGQSDAESGLIREGARIQSLSPFEVGFFKGEAWQGNAGRGAVHRSPAGTGRRVVLTLEAL